MSESRDLPAPLVEVRDLAIGHAGVSLVPPISFDLRAGQVTSLVGHNGSGKSTLLRTLLGLIPRVSGEIRFSPAARFGYVPQRETLDPIYPVKAGEFVEAGRYGLRGVGRRLRREDHQRIDQVMEATGSAHLKARLFRELSGGEQQRVLLARALCSEPTILVLDEPTASMDERAANEAMRLTLDLARKLDAAVVMVNHFIDLVEQISDQVVLLDRDYGAVKVGDPKQLLQGRGRYTG